MCALQNANGFLEINFYFNYYNAGNIANIPDYQFISKYTWA